METDTKPLREIQTPFRDEILQTWGRIIETSNEDTAQRKEVLMSDGGKMRSTFLRLVFKSIRKYCSKIDTVTVLTWDGSNDYNQLI